MTQRWLEADQATGELRLVMANLYQGRHERDEFRAVGSEGVPLRAARLPDVIGLPVEYRPGPGGSEYTVRMPSGAQVRVHVENRAVGPTQNHPLPEGGEPAPQVRAVRRGRRPGLTGERTR